MSQDKYAAQRKWRAANIDKVRAYNTAYTRRTQNNVKYRYHRLKARAKKLGRKFNISMNKYVDMINAGCYYCGKSLKNEKGGSLDRTNNNNYNYTFQNTRACCTDCNNLKNYQLTEKETLFVVKKLKEYRKKNGFKQYRTNSDIRRIKRGKKR